MNARQIITQNRFRKTLAEFELLITKEIALLMLRHNTQNRTTSKAHIDHLAQQFATKNYESIADGIAYDSNGVLVDGQHRLLAAVEQNVTFKCKVMFGLNPKARLAVDIASRVTDGALLEEKGLTFGSLRAAVAKLYLSQVTEAESGIKKYSIEQIYKAALELGPELDIIVTHAADFGRLELQTPLLFALTIGLKRNRQATNAFIEKLINIERKGPQDPLVKFEKLTRKEKGRTRIELYQAGLRCIRAFIEGTPIERVHKSDNELTYFIAA